MIGNFLFFSYWLVSLSTFSCSFSLIISENYGMYIYFFFPIRSSFNNITRYFFLFFFLKECKKKMYSYAYLLRIIVTDFHVCFTFCFAFRRIISHKQHIHFLPFISCYCLSFPNLHDPKKNVNFFFLFYQARQIKFILHVNLKKKKWMNK